MKPQFPHLDIHSHDLSRAGSAVVNLSPGDEIPAGAYKYCLMYEGKSVYDSLDLGDYYDSYEEAREAAESYMEDYEILTDEYPSDWLYPIEAEKVEIVEFDDEEE